MYIDVGTDDDSGDNMERDSGVVRRQSGIERRTYASASEEKGGHVPKYLTMRDKVDQWEQVALRSVIREKLYPFAKIIFNSERELAFDGKICNMIFKHMRMDDAYRGCSEVKKKSTENVCGPSGVI